MKGTLPAETRPAQNRNQGKTVVLPTLRPGPELMEVISGGLRPPDALRGWRLVMLDGIELGVPWCAWLRHTGDGNFDVLPDLPEPKAVLRGTRGQPHWGLIYSLDRGYLAPARELAPHEVTNARRLIAAAMADIAGLQIESKTEKAIVDLLGLQHPEHAARLAREGRKLWANLGAWPWFHWPEGRAPSGWNSGIGPALARQLDIWHADGRLHLPLPRA